MGDGWVELWRGDLSAGETKTLTYTLYIPEDAKPGSIVAWVTVEFGADNFYTYKDGSRYYVPYDVVQVLGALPDPQVDALKRQVEQLRANYTALQLNYTDLRARCAALYSVYTELKAGHEALQKSCGELQTRNKALEQELSAVRSERDRLQGELRAWTITAVVAGLAGLAAGAALASLRRKPS